MPYFQCDMQHTYPLQLASSSLVLVNDFIFNLVNSSLVLVRLHINRDQITIRPMGLPRLADYKPMGLDRFGFWFHMISF